MEDFVRKTKGVRDITSLPLDTSHELDIVSDVKGKIYIKILNRYKELLFDNGTEQWVIDMLNNLEVDVEQLKEDILDVEQALSELPMIEDKLKTVETSLAQINTLFAQMQIDVQGIDLRTAELEREVVQLALKDQELLDKINNLAKSSETVDARLTKTISTYDTVNALQNNRLTALESKVVDTTWQNVAVTEPFTSVTQPQVKKQNGIVYMRGTMSNGTGDCFTLPEGFRPPEGAYEMQFRLPCRSASAGDYATIYVRPSGLCSIVGVNGTKPIFLSGIIFSTT